MDEQLDGPTDVQTDGKMDGWTDGRTNWLVKMRGLQGNQNEFAFKGIRDARDKPFQRTHIVLY